MKRIRGEARYAKRMARQAGNPIPTRPGESLIDTVRAARAGNVPRGTRPPNPRFLAHIARTKAKPHPIAKGVRVRGLDLPPRSLADVLGVPPETKMTSLPLPDSGIVVVNDRESK